MRHPNSRMHWNGLLRRRARTGVQVHEPDNYGQFRNELYHLCRYEQTVPSGFYTQLDSS